MALGARSTGQAGRRQPKGLPAAATKVDLPRLSAIVADAAQPVRAAVAVVVVEFQATRTQVIHLKGVAALGPCPKEPHDGLPLLPVGSAARAVQLKDDHMGSLVRDRLGEEFSAVADQQRWIVTDKAAAPSDNAYLAGSPAAQIKEHIRCGKPHAKVEPGSREQPVSVLRGPMLQRGVAGPGLRWPLILHPGSITQRWLQNRIANFRCLAVV